MNGGMITMAELVKRASEEELPFPKTPHMAFNGHNRSAASFPAVTPC